jgi:hypothetical protein
MKKILLLLLTVATAQADYVREDSLAIPGAFIDNGDSTPIVFFEKSTGMKFCGVRFVSDGDRAQHGRLALYGKCIDPFYENWNCGAIDFSNVRSSKMDNRIAIIRARGYNSDPETSGLLDFFTWDEQDHHFNIGLHIDAKGRISAGAGHGYPFANHASAWLMLSPGRSTQGYAPMKFSTGELLETPENGAVEFDGNQTYITINGERRIIATTPAPSKFWKALWAK